MITTPQPGRPPGLSRHWPAAALVALAVPLILVGLDRYSLVNNDEEIYHVVARNMAETGDWIRLQYYDEHRVYDTFMNAPLQYWARAALISVFGDNMWTARLLTALAAIGSVLVTYRLGLHMTGSRRTAFLAGVIQLTTFQFVYLHSARTGELEPFVTLLYTLIAHLFIRSVETGRSFVPHHLCLVLLLNLKTPTVLIPLLAEGACFVLLPATRSSFRRFALPALAILPLGLIWHASQMIALWQPFQEVMAEMAGQAASHGRAHPWSGRVASVGFYASTILFGGYPYSLVYPIALFVVLRGERSDALRWRTLAIFVASVLLFYLMVSKRHHWYVIPAYPLLSLFVARWLEGLPRRSETLGLVGLLAGLGALLLWWSPNLDYDPFMLKSWKIPMRLYWREIAGLPAWIGLPLSAAAIFVGLEWLRRRRPGRLCVAGAAALAVGLPLYGLVRVARPLGHLDRQSDMALLRAELDALERAGNLPEFPIEPSVSLGWDGRYYLGDRYRIVVTEGRRFVLYPLDPPGGRGAGESSPAPGHRRRAP